MKVFEEQEKKVLPSLNNFSGGHPLRVVLREEDHRYFDQNGLEYISASKFRKPFESVFDAEKQSQRMVAKTHVRGTPEFDKAVKTLRSKWSSIGTKSSGRGTLLHAVQESYSRDKIWIEGSEEFKDKIIHVESLLSGYSKHYYEEVMHYTTPSGLRIAGTADRPVLNSRGWLSIYDYKFNERKGISFTDKYAKFMNHCCSHLTNCNFNHYSIQLSLYAYMSEATYGYKIDRLGIIDYQKALPIIHPVVYQKELIKLMIDNYVELTAPQ